MDKQIKRPAGKSAAAIRQRPVQSRNKPQSKAAAEVVYTQAKPFSKGKFLLRLLTVVAIVVALVLGMSIFFKVESVEVSGTVNYTAWDIMEAAGIQTGENLLTLNKAAVSGRILQKLPYVDSVRIGIKLPDTVNIEIVEEDVFYAIEAADSTWWLIDDSGKILEQTNAAAAADHTKVLGVQLESPVPGQKAVAYEPALETSDPADSSTETTVPVTVYAEERLEAAVSILGLMESNGVLGIMTTVDVSELGDIVLQYGKIFRIELGDTTQLARKIGTMADTIDQHASSYESGTLDISFTTWPDQVGFSPDNTNGK